MKALILAAGFGTRMGELSVKTAKPLLPVAGKPVAQHLAEKVFDTGSIDEIVVISNHYYIEQFREWIETFSHPGISLIDDGAMTNETRLGAISDMRIAIERSGINEPLFVMAGDNLFEYDFAELISFFEEKQTDVVTGCVQNDIERLRKTGVAKVDENGRLTGFQEKPQEPESNLAVPCIYIFTTETLSMIEEYTESGNNPDAPGHFINWLHTRRPIHVFSFDSPLHCIGDPESYVKTCKKLER